MTMKLGTYHSAEYNSVSHRWDAAVLAAKAYDNLTKDDKIRCDEECRCKTKSGDSALNG
jgi:hypothetical protein